MYTLEGVSSVANFTTAYEEIQLNRDSHFLIICFQRQSFLRLFYYIFRYPDIKADRKLYASGLLLRGDNSALFTPPHKLLN